MKPFVTTSRAHAWLQPGSNIHSCWSFSYPKMFQTIPLQYSLIRNINKYIPPFWNLQCFVIAFKMFYLYSLQHSMYIYICVCVFLSCSSIPSDDSYSLSNFICICVSFFFFSIGTFILNLTTIWCFRMVINNGVYYNYSHPQKR